MTYIDRIGSDIDRASAILRDGGIVGMPTETVYGLAARALDETAVHRVFATKGRPKNHPLIVHLAPNADVSQWGVVSSHTAALMEAFWPGPLTLLIPRTPLVPDWVTGGRDSVAIRIPSHPMAVALLQGVADGVVAPSANMFGRVSPTTGQHVLDDLGELVDYVLDGGRCEVGIESTIVDCTGQALCILRPGAITEVEIAHVTGLELTDNIGESRAPGMLVSHYSPTATVVLVQNHSEAQSKKIELEKSGNSVVIIDEPDEERFARELYAYLRSADSDGFSHVVVVEPRGTGLSVAIRDRLLKASA
jgi:L-threonylcarbamoyladenylate synthase